MSMEVSWPIVIGAAIIDGINPCAIGVLILMLGYLLKTFNSRRKLIVNGFLYVFAAFLTYFLAGVGLLTFVRGLNLTTPFYWAAGIIAVVAGLLEIKDFFWYGKGPQLAILPSAAQRIKLYAGGIAGNPSTAFALGVFVALVELPCTGAVYLALLGLMTPLSWEAILPYLVVYNAIFVAPLAGIVFIVYKGTGIEQIQAWKNTHKQLMRLMVGLFLLAMGAWMIATVLAL